MDGATTVTELHLKADNTVTAEFSNVEWYVSHTSLSALTENFSDNYDGNTPRLFYSDSDMKKDVFEGEWFGFTCEPPFDYNGTDNLIFEVRFNGPSEGSIMNNGSSRPGHVLEASNSSTSETGTIKNLTPGLRIYHGGTGVITLKNKTGHSDIFSINRTRGNNFVMRYSISGPADTKILLYALSGRLINVLVNERKTSGTYSALWDSKDERGVSVASGIYFAVLVNKTMRSISKVTNEVYVIQ